MCRGNAAKALLGAINKYDDALRVATWSFNNYSTKFDDVFKSDEFMALVFEKIVRGRGALAASNFLQATFRSYPDDQARAASIKQAVTKLPKSGNNAMPKALCDMANDLMT